MHMGALSYLSSVVTPPLEPVRSTGGRNRCTELRKVPLRAT